MAPRAGAPDARGVVGADPEYPGIISIARRRTKFTRPEEELLEYLGGQAVVSIENANLHETVERQAVTDELTGLANARAFQSRTARLRKATSEKRGFEATGEVQSHDLRPRDYFCYLPSPSRLAGMPRVIPSVYRRFRQTRARLSRKADSPLSAPRACSTR